MLQLGDYFITVLGLYTLILTLTWAGLERFHSLDSLGQAQIGLTYSLLARYLLTYSLTHLLTYSLTHLLTYSLTHLLTLGLTAMYLVQGRSTNLFMQVFT